MLGYATERKIWRTSDVIEVPNKFKTILKSTYKILRAKVQAIGQRSGECEMNKGTKQGDSPSLLLIITCSRFDSQMKNLATHVIFQPRVR